MELVSVGAAAHLDVIRDHIEAELAKNECEASLKTASKGTFQFVSVVLSEHRPVAPAALERYLRSVARAVADSILVAFEPALLERALARRFGGFADAERTAILDSARRTLAGPADAIAGTAARRDHVARSLLEHLRGRQEVVVEGLIAFRLRDYTGVLEESVAQAVDEFLLEGEYREFVRLLRYFVAVQTPKTALAHLVMEGEAFRLLDVDGQPIDASHGECVAQTLEASINVEDVLLSALITAAPKRIRLHGMRGAAAGLQTVRRVFEGRLEACRRRPCALCPDGRDAAGAGIAVREER